MIHMARFNFSGRASVLVRLVSVRTTTHQVDDEDIRGAGTLSSSSGLRVPHRVMAGPGAFHGERQGKRFSQTGSDVSHFHDDPFTY